MSRAPAPRSRAREAGLRIPGMPPGPFNAITDVPGVKVGHSTLWSGEGPLVPGSGPVRTGCTAIVLGPGNTFRAKFPAAVHVLNGFGKAVGLPQVVELGEIETPILLTNTLNVGRVADALLDYLLQLNPDVGTETGTINPVVLECNDSELNDIRGRHVGRREVFDALESASGNEVAEGVVGAGTGMRCYGHKGGIGTSSRIVGVPRGAGDEELWEGEDTYVLGALVMSNFGTWEDFRLIGAPVGSLLPAPDGQPADPGGSVAVVLVTDAPVDARQLGRIAQRGALGLGRTGSIASNGSGDFIVAVSTNERIPHSPGGYRAKRDVFIDGHPGINAIFRAAVEATEEAVINSLFVADTVSGRDGNISPGLPVDDCLAIVDGIFEGSDGC